MTRPDRLLVSLAAAVEAQHSSMMALTVVVPGAVITGRVAPESLWRERVAEVLRDSRHLSGFSGVFAAAQDVAPGAGGPPREAAGDGGSPGHGDGGSPGGGDGQPTHLHFHLARILQGSFGIPDSGGMYRVALADVSAWSIGDIGYSDQ